MTNQEIINKLTEAFNKGMGNAYFRAGYYTGLTRHISLGFGIQEQSKHANGIRQNDPSFHSVLIFGFDEEGNSTDNMEVSSGTGGTISINPPKDSHLCYGRVKTGFRKKNKATGEQVVKHLTNYFKKLRKAVDANRENIPFEVV